MIEAIFFDVDGTIYDESYPKAVAELLLAKQISSICDYSSSEVYDAFRKIKSEFVKSSSSDFSRNDRILWFKELLNYLQITSVTSEKLNELYWNSMLNQVFPYEDFMYILPWLQQNFNLFVLTDESVDLCTKKTPFSWPRKYISGNFFF